MKKTALLLALSAAAFSAHAQYHLLGASYTQNFDGIAGGLPTGWYIYNNATASSIGTAQTFNGSASYGVYADTITSGCISAVYGGAFKNFPSATVATKDLTCTAQQAITNRALGVRQIGSNNSDPGASINFEMANTSGCSAFNLTFKLQSLDTTSERVTTWKVQYGTGATPTTWTDASTGSSVMTTGNFAFTNNTVTVSFGTALDNTASPVWIRIVTLNATSGSNRRASSAIDDFSLTWTGHPTAVANVNAANEISLGALGAATSEQVNFAFYAAEAGNYNLAICDLSGRVVRTQTMNLQAGQQNFSVEGLNMTPGMYIAKINNATASSTTKFVVR